MTTSPVWDASSLLDDLEDPFTMFPVQSVARTLFEAVDEAERGTWGSPWSSSARKYWSVEQEHSHEVMGLLLGAIFVLGQAAITQTVSILNQLRRHPQAQHVIPKNKASKLIAHADREEKTNLSKIVIIDAVSNYFKHVYEWPKEWAIPAKGVHAETINIVLGLEMKPGEMTDNLLLAANRLGLCHSNPQALASNIQGWRSGWAGVLYPTFGLPDPNDWSRGL